MAFHSWLISVEPHPTPIPPLAPVSRDRAGRLVRMPVLGAGKSNGIRRG